VKPAETIQGILILHRAALKRLCSLEKAHANFANDPGTCCSADRITTHGKGTAFSRATQPRMHESARNHLCEQIISRSQRFVLLQAQLSANQRGRHISRRSNCPEQILLELG
jgi:hypothetical protein